MADIQLELKTPSAEDATDKVVVRRGATDPYTVELVALSGKANASHTQAASTITDFSEAVDDRVAALVVAGTNMTVTYNDAANTLTLDATGGGATNLTYTAATRVVASDTGTDATLPLVTSGDAGLAPASGGGTANFLRADGTWVAPGGSGDMVLASAQTNSALKTFLTGTFGLRNVANTFTALFSNTVTAARTYTLKDADGTIAFVSDITGINSGTNTGDQTITLTGNVTGSGTGSFAATIAAGAVTLARMADVATGTLFYRKTAGTGAPEVQTLATLKTDLGLTGTNSGDQTTITGITGTKAQFDAAVSDGNILYVGDITQYTDELAQDAVGAMVDASLTYVDATPLLQRAALTGHITAPAGSNATVLGSFTKAQLDTAVSDGNVLYVGDVTSNATHTGDVTGATALTIDPTAISGKTLVTAVGADHVLIFDATDSLLKKALVSDFAGGGGVSDGDKVDITISGGGTIYTVDPLNINTQSGATYTPVLTDRKAVVHLTNAGTKAITVPTNAAVTYGAGDMVPFRNNSGGTATFSFASGITVNGIAGPYSFEVLVGQTCVMMAGTVADTWTAMVSGSTVFKGTGTITVPNNSFDHSEVITATGVTATSLIFLSLAPHLDADENSPEMLDLVALVGTPGTNQITVGITFSQSSAGPIKLNWSAF